MKIDATFDFRSDTPTGKDPDKLSPTLRQYHKQLWSKPLPSGNVFKLFDTTPRVYLHHQSEIGEFFLASDAVIPCFTKERKLAHIFDQIPEWEIEAFETISYTIGGMMVFPGKAIERKMTINQARGCHPLIKDHFDLTLECIRRHYLKESSPLEDTMERYADFFNLFESFSGYVEYFLLQDMVTEDLSSVKFFMPFGGFQRIPVPSSMETYIAYKNLAIEFIKARNRRILEFG